MHFHEQPVEPQVGHTLPFECDSGLRRPQIADTKLGPDEIFKLCRLRSPGGPKIESRIQLRFLHPQTEYRVCEVLERIIVVPDHQIVFTHIPHPSNLW